MTDLQTFVRWQDVDPASVVGRTVVVIDVLRWSTVVVTALAHGAAWVEAFASASEAEARAAELRARGVSRRAPQGAPHGSTHEASRQPRDDEPLGVLLGGERATRALPGFDVGNSPGEYTRERVAGRVVITTTTNGTQALAAARRAHEVLVAAFVNVDAVVARLRVARAAGRGITLVAAGTEGVEAPEDTGCAGAIAARLGEGSLLRSADAHDATAFAFDAATLRAIALWDASDRDAARLIGDAPHAATLVANGFAADVAAAARPSATPLQIVPRLGLQGRISI